MTSIPRYATARGLLADPLLISAVSGYLVVCVLLLVWPADPGGKVLLFWTAEVALDLGLALASLALVRLPTPNPGARRFYLAFCGASVLFVAADGAQVVEAVVRPGLAAATPGLPQSICAALAVLPPLVAVLAYPIAMTTRRQRVRFWLDLITVMAGAAVFSWSLMISPQVTGRDPVNDAAVLATAAVFLVGAFALLKVLLSQSPPMTVAGGSVMVVSAVLYGVFAGLPTPTAQDLPVNLSLRLLPAVLVLASCCVQRVMVRVDPAAAGRRRQRQFSLLPYAAVGATYLLLVRTLPDRLTGAAVGAVIGIGVITALVVARQVLAISDNSRLISDLDHSLVEARQLHDRLRHEATHDPLTRLANRALFTERLATVLAGRPDGGRGGAAVVLVDLDNFKTINDTGGHHVGDAVLVAVAERIRSCFRTEDITARLGGDEFAVLIALPSTGANGAVPGVTAAPAPPTRSVAPARPVGAVAEHRRVGQPVPASSLTAMLVERLMVALHSPVEADGRLLTVAASVGVASGYDLSGDELLQAADAAMYQAKRRGKGQVVAIPAYG
jgi:GGDEF domain-containing protein